MSLLKDHKKTNLTVTPEVTGRKNMKRRTQTSVAGTVGKLTGKKEDKITVNGKSLTLTNLNKIYWPDDSGKEFDEKWCKEMIDKHEESIDAFEKRMEDTGDAELKSWISKTLPLLRTHHNRLKAFHENLKANKS